MLIWSSKMYLDEKFAGKRRACQKFLEEKRPGRAVYCITLPVNGKNIMEIYSSRELWFRYYRERSLVVIGLAATREHAKKLAAQICLDILQEQGDISPATVREYFQETERGQSGQ